MQIQTDLSKYIVNVQGKDFITFPGLLAEAHAQGLLAIETQLVNEDLTNPVMKATVHIKGESLPSGQPQVKLFTGYGDANANNVAKKVAGALIRMAETRAVARALRFACNIDMTAVEEIGVEDDAVVSAPRTFKAPTLSVPTTGEAVSVTVSGPDKDGNNTTTINPITTQPNDTSQVTAKRTFSKRPTNKTEPKFP